MLRLEQEELVAFSDKKDAAFRRRVLKAQRFPVYAHCEYISRSQNRWIVFFESRSRKEIGDLCRLHFVCYSHSTHGIYAFHPQLSRQRFFMTIYPPHFFSRYRDRAQIPLSGIPLLIRFFERNYSYVFEIFNREYVEIAGSTSEGVALGLLTETGNVLFKTFITYDMLKGDQIETFTRNEKMRQEIHETEL